MRKLNHLTGFIVGVGTAALVWSQPTSAAPSASSTVVPGQSLGKVSLGASAAQVRKTLGKPNASLVRKDGLVADIYQAKQPRKVQYGGTIRDSVTVLYRRGRVVQIEATSPIFKTARGISTDTALKVWEPLLRDYRVYTYEYIDPEGGGWRNYYVDDRQQGLAFEFEGYQDFATWESNANTIIVHPKGTKVMADEGGDLITQSKSPAIMMGN